MSKNDHTSLELGVEPSSEEETKAEPLGGFSLMLSLGFGLHWAWVYATTIDSQRIFFSGADPTSTSLAFYTISLVFLIVTSAGCGIWSMIRNKVGDAATVPDYRWVVLIAGVIDVCGTGGLLFADCAHWQSTIVLVYAATMTGIGSALLLVLWGEAYGRNDSKTVVLNASIGLASAFLIYVAIAGMPTPFGAIICTIIPIPEALLLRKALARRSPSIPVFNKRNFKRGRYVVRLGIPILIFGFSLGILRELSVKEISQNASGAWQLVMIGGALVALVLIVASMLVFSKTSRGFFYRPMFLASLVAVALLSTGAALPELSPIILLVAYICFEVLIWSALAEQAYDLKIPAIMVFGMGKALLSTGTLLGAANLKINATLSASFAFGSTAFALFLIITMVAAYCFWPQEKDIRKEILPPRTKKEPEREVLGTVDHDIGMACSKLADDHALSTREAEILYLLARGRNTSFISEELFISINTVKSHVRHIYQKLGVHSQQALIDMMEKNKLQQANEDGSSV